MVALDGRLRSCIFSIIRCLNTLDASDGFSFVVSPKAHKTETLIAVVAHPLSTSVAVLPSITRGFQRAFRGRKWHRLTVNISSS